MKKLTLLSALLAAAIAGAAQTNGNPYTSAEITLNTHWASDTNFCSVVHGDTICMELKYLPTWVKFIRFGDKVYQIQRPSPYIEEVPKLGFLFQGTGGSYPLTH